MQELFFTLLIIWLLFRIFGNKTVHRSFTFKMNKHEAENREEKVKVNYVPPKNKSNADSKTQGEYIDYEDLPLDR